MQNAYQVQHSDFSDRVDIVCPKCAHKALLKAGESHEGQASESARCVCTRCGYSSDLRRDGFSLTLWGGGVDPYFHHPLWYMAPCLEGTIWAYNLPHLELIEHFIAATDRGRSGLPNKNISIAARLPKWMSAAKNRVTVLKCIRGLKMKCILLLLSISLLASCSSSPASSHSSPASSENIASGIDPFSTASRVELLHYNDRMDWWAELGDSDRPLLQDGKLDIPADSILSRTQLDSDGQSKWKQALYGSEFCTDSLVSYCYQPRNMLLFYNTDDSILGYI